MKYLILLACVLWFLPCNGQDQSLRFAQLTDLHLFDAGYQCYAQDVDLEQGEAVKALDWAIQTINEENKRQALDFVVITGDVGLQNLVPPGGSAPARGKPTRNACNSSTPMSDKFGPVASISVDDAASILVAKFRLLAVKDIYLLPGNNDTVNESPTDRAIYQAFVAALNKQLSGRVKDLTAAPIDAGEYRLVGMDTVAFKPTKVEETQMLNAIKAVPGSDNPSACVVPAGDESATARTTEINRVAGVIGAKQSKVLLFTHEPDVQDPWAGRQTNGGKCRYKSAWFLSPDGEKTWKAVVANPNVVAIFAGHLHTSEARYYGGPFDAASAAADRVSNNANVAAGTAAGTVAAKDKKDSTTKAGTAVATVAEAKPCSAPAKIYIDEPLSLKNQWVKSPQRGLAIVTVGGGKANFRLVGFATKMFETAGGGATPGCWMCHAKRRLGGVAALVTMLLIALVICLGWKVGKQVGVSGKDLFFFSLIDRSTKTYSLSRLQFFLWTAVALFGYIYLFGIHLLLLHQAEIPDISSTFLGLLGIATGSAMTSIGAQSLGFSKGAGPTSPAWTDLISDSGEVEPDRVQFLFWNLVAAVTYLVFLMRCDPCFLIKLPDVPGNILVLAGLSTGGYVLGKFARKPGPNLSTVTPPPPPPPPPAGGGGAGGGAIPPAAGGGDGGPAPVAVAAPVAAAAVPLRNFVQVNATGLTEGTKFLFSHALENPAKESFEPVAGLDLPKPNGRKRATMATVYLRERVAGTLRAVNPDRRYSDIQLQLTDIGEKP